MSQFVTIGKTRVNTEYISKVEELDDGTVRVFVDSEPARIVSGDDAKALLEAITPGRIVGEPLRLGGMGAAGLPDSAFAKPRTDDAPSEPTPDPSPGSKGRAVPKAPAPPAAPEAPKAE